MLINKGRTQLNVHSIVVNALQQSRTKDAVGDSSGVINRNRSSEFVKQLAAEYNKFYEGDEAIRVLSSGNNSNRTEFGLNELLYDVTVCSVTNIESSKQGKQLTLVTQTLWSVESELRRDSREAIYDFNKLVMSNADNKLFIGPLVDDIDSYISVLSKAAKYCEGSLYLALIPHPSTWNETSIQPLVWSWIEDEWRPDIQGS